MNKCRLNPTYEATDSGEDVKFVGWVDEGNPTLIVDDIDVVGQDSDVGFRR